MGVPQRRLLVALAVLFGVALAFSLRFVQDDAYISFRYAKNLIAGLGLVFNAGEHTEGYTNLLWTLLVSLPMRLGIDPAAGSLWTGLAIYPFTLWAAWRLFRSGLGSWGWALVGLGLLVTNYTFASYATGGLETQLQTLLFLASCLCAARVIASPTVRSAFLLSGVASLALLCRLDSGVVLAVCYGFVLWHLLRTSRAREAAAAVALPAVTLIVWSLWRHSFYGAWLPNTFAVKVGGYSHLDTGVAYWGAFISAYLTPVIALACPYIAWRARSMPIRIASAIAFVWMLYVVAVGGDFMEFRMGSVVYPFLVASLLYCLMRVRFEARYKLVVPALLVLASGAYPFSQRRFEGISSFEQLRGEVDSDYGWVFVGKRLRQIFGPGSTVSIATSAAGAVPYYSELRTVDMLGLNDSDVAHHGLRIRERPGHEVKATVRQLLDKKVNLVLGNPQVLGVPVLMPASPGFWLRIHFRADPDFQAVASQGNAVLIPLDDKAVLLAWYLTPSAEIDQKIREGHWQQVPMSALLGG